MIYGIGCDLVQVARIKNLYLKFKKRFLKKVFTEYEIANSPKNEKSFIEYLAKRFAAKEAFAKAMGTGIGCLISFNEIEVFKENSSKPQIRLLKNINGIGSIHLSISDDRAYAMAYVIIEKADE